MKDSFTVEAGVESQSQENDCKDQETSCKDDKAYNASNRKLPCLLHAQHPLSASQRQALSKP